VVTGVALVVSDLLIAWPGLVPSQQ